jgi:RNA polymerase sigma-B factor
VSQYTSLVESVARRFSGAAEPAEDLAQEGYIGLLNAIEGFNASKGVKFSTYATHFIIGQIKHYLRDRGKIIKEPAWLQELNQRVSRVIESLTQELGRVPTPGEVATQTGMTEEAVADLLTTREIFKVGSLDGGSEQDDEGSSTYNMDRVKPDKAVEFEMPVDERVVLEAALSKLKDLEQSVIHEFYFRERNQTEIARSMGISCNYVSHILRNSTKKLRKIMTSDELRESQMELARLRKQMAEQTQFIEEHTVIDTLTRLYNRRYFESRLEEELSRASRHGHPVSVMMLRLAGHAQVSRAWGTIKAEDSIRACAHLLRAGVRRVDIVTRFDEETFALILPHTGEQVTVVEARLSKAVGAFLVEEGLHQGRSPVELWVGSAVYPRHAETGAGLAEFAANALDRAFDEVALIRAA